MTVIPAYGRDYKSAKDAKADWLASKDFLIHGIGSSGYINITDAVTAGPITIRYAKMRKCVIVNT